MAHQFSRTITFLIVPIRVTRFQRRGCGHTRNGTLLESVPVGTVTVRTVFENTSITAGLPLKVTLVAPARLFPSILTTVPTLPEVGSISTNPPKLSDRLKTEPQP
jgi:hypothetical protein